MRLVPYVFYMAIVAASVSFIDSGVFAFIYPAMVAASGRNDKEEFSLLLKKMFFQSFSFSHYLRNYHDPLG